MAIVKRVFRLTFLDAPRKESGVTKSMLRPPGVKYRLLQVSDDDGGGVMVIQLTGDEHKIEDVMWLWADGGVNVESVDDYADATDGHAGPQLIRPKVINLLGVLALVGLVVVNWHKTLGIIIFATASFVAGAVGVWANIRPFTKRARTQVNRDEERD